MAYTITLYHSNLDADNNNVVLYNSQQELINALNSGDHIVIANQNFDAKNIISTSIVIDPIVAQTPLITLLNFNYCKVEDDQGTDVLFYWIRHSTQIDGGLIRCELTIDPFNTYIYGMIGSNDKLQGMVERCHIDRFVKSGDNYVYNFRNDSPLFERETIQGVSQRPTQKKQLKLSFGSLTDVDEWYNENVSHWIYYFLSDKENYTINGQQVVLPTMKYRKFATTDDEDSSLVVVAVPVYKRGFNTGSIYVGNKKIDTNAVLTFLQANNGYAYVRAIKKSIIPAIEPRRLFVPNAYTIDSNGNLIFDETIYNESTPASSIYAVDSGQSSICVKNYQSIYLDNQLYIDNDFYKIEHTVNDIKSGVKDPKLYNEDYAVYRIYFGGQQYNMPVAKSSPKPAFIYHEILTPDITKFILAFDSQTPATNNPFGVNSIFSNINKYDYTGLVGTLDTSMWYAVDQLDAFLATNKNNLQIFQNQQQVAKNKLANESVFGVVGGALGGAFASATQGKDPIVGGIMGGATGLLNSMRNSVSLQITQEAERVQRELTFDNMREAPDTLSTINSNALLIESMGDVDNNESGFGIFIELQEAIAFEQRQIEDQLQRSGYNYNIIDDVRNYFKTRKYYNYVQANVFELNINVGEDIKQAIKNMFANGVRIWHGDTFTGIDFAQINYERSIDNGNN